MALTTPLDPGVVVELGLANDSQNLGQGRSTLLVAYWDDQDRVLFVQVLNEHGKYFASDFRRLDHLFNPCSVQPRSICMEVQAERILRRQRELIGDQVFEDHLVEEVVDDAHASHAQKTTRVAPGHDVLVPEVAYLRSLLGLQVHRLGQDLLERPNSDHFKFEHHLFEDCSLAPHSTGQRTDAQVARDFLQDEVHEAPQVRESHHSELLIDTQLSHQAMVTFL